MEPVIFKLKETLKTHKGEISELELQPPRGSSFLKHGPIISEVMSGPPNDRRQNLSFNYAAVFGFLQDMTGHDAIILGGLSAQDTEQLAYTVNDMIRPRPI